MPPFTLRFTTTRIACVPKRSKGQFPTRSRKMSDTHSVCNEAGKHTLDGAKPMLYQIAGAHKDQKSSALLKCQDGTLLKRVQRPPKGPREVEFYQKVKNASTNNESLSKLRELMPKFYGTANGIDPFEDIPVQYIKLEDVTSYFHKPCVIDIKMGRKTYDPEAPPEKIESESKKYPPLESIGFQIQGIKVYNRETGAYDSFDNKYGRSLLTEDDVIRDGLARYFGGEKHLQKDAISDVIKQLYPISKWFESQTSLSFYGGSLLIVYEGSASESVNNNDTESPHSIINGDLSPEKLDATKPDKVHKSGTVKVKMIDFAHVFPINEIDMNYLFGLRNLIAYLEKLLKIF